LLRHCSSAGVSITARREKGNSRLKGTEKWKTHPEEFKFRNEEQLRYAMREGKKKGKFAPREPQAASKKRGKKKAGVWGRI